MHFIHCVAVDSAKILKNGLNAICFNPFYYSKYGQYSNTSLLLLKTEYVACHIIQKTQIANLCAESVTLSENSDCFKTLTLTFQK